MREEHLTNGAPAPAALPAELDGYREQFEAIKRDAADLTAGLSEAQFNWRPAPGAWSIAECLAHLNVTGQYFLPRIDRRVREARAAGMLSEGPFRYGLLSRMMVRGSEPPAKLKFKAPKIFSADVGTPHRRQSCRIHDASGSLVERLARRRGVDLRRVKVTSPGPASSKSASAGLPFIAATSAGHLWQAAG